MSHTFSHLQTDLIRFRALLLCFFNFRTIVTFLPLKKLTFAESRLVLMYVPHFGLPNSFFHVLSPLCILRKLEVASMVLIIFRLHILVKNTASYFVFMSYQAHDIWFIPLLVIKVYLSWILTCQISLYKGTFSCLQSVSNLRIIFLRGVNILFPYNLLPNSLVAI